MSESDIESIAKESEEAEDEDFYEPPSKKYKQELKGVLAGMTKVVNKPLHNGEILNEDLSVYGCKVRSNVIGGFPSP